MEIYLELAEKIKGMDFTRFEKLILNGLLVSKHVERKFPSLFKPAKAKYELVWRKKGDYAIPVSGKIATAVRKVIKKWEKR